MPDFDIQCSYVNLRHTLNCVSGYIIQGFPTTITERHSLALFSFAFLGTFESWAESVLEADHSH